VQGRKSKILDHPLGKAKTVVEVVQINLGCEDGVRRRSLELAEEIWRGQLNFFGLVKQGVGRNSVDDETKRILILGDGEDTVDDVN
jgi:hypothetical protein